MRRPCLLLAGAAAAAIASWTGAAAAGGYGSREYNRGYYDCLAGRYDEEASGRAYRQGCRAAERERADESGGGCPPGGCEGMGGGPGFRPPPSAPFPVAPVGIPNVKGMQPPNALAAMASRGYRNVGTSVAGAAILSIYFNPVTRECVQLGSANGRVFDAREIGSHPRCR
jgi:hypothetical protein